jgi:iron complex outermembrane receptor protein
MISKRTLALCLLAPAALPVCANAQVGSQFPITGTVLDQHGSAIPNAAVSLRNESTDAVQKATADATGHFSSSALTPGKYLVEASAQNFGTTRKEVTLGNHAEDVTLPLSIGSANEQVTVEATASGSIAAALAPMDGLLEARSARTEISSAFIQNFTSPVSDFSEILQMAPGTFSVNSNGVGLGDSKTYFRGFPDGDYDINFDGIPFEDTNSPTHHSWAFFPAPWIGGVDFDRSPGSASTIGPTPFGGSINLLSRDLSPVMDVRGGVSYGSFNTILTDGQFESGNLGSAAHPSTLFVDFNRLTSDGFQTWNAQERNAGSLKYQLRVSPKTTLTGFSGVLWLDTNTPNAKGPTRAQVAANGYNYLLQNTDSTQANYAPYNFYHVPTDFEYVGLRSELAKGWLLDVKPYTYSYYNQQNYGSQPKTGAINLTNCVDVVSKATADSPAVGIQPCGTDKLNSYRKYGEVSTVSQTSKYGVFRTGMWYEWATTARHQIPQNPITHVDDVLPNFNEKFYTNSYQPFAEYEYHATSKLTLTGGFKYAHYNQDLTQYADNGKTIGNRNPVTGVAFTSQHNSVGYNAYMPSADANYRIKSNWSAYGQYATGSIIPPSNVYDVAGAVVLAPPAPTTARTFQGGTVLKLSRMTFNADAYYIHFGNGYTAPADPNGEVYTSSGDSVTKGFEGETNVYLTHGLSLYANGTAGAAHYVSQTLTSSTSTTSTTSANPNYQAWVANTPANTEAIGLTYQRKTYDFGFFHKRVGPMWNDGTFASGGNANQYIPIAPFNIDNLFLNYTIRSNSHLDGTKLRFSINNLLNTENITSLTSGTTAVAGVPYAPSTGDTLGLTPGRSFTMTVIFGYSPKR